MKDNTLILIIHLFIYVMVSLVFWSTDRDLHIHSALAFQLVWTAGVISCILHKLKPKPIILCYFVTGCSFGIVLLKECWVLHLGPLVCRIEEGVSRE